MAKYGMKNGGKKAAKGAVGRGENESSLQSYDPSVGDIRKGSAPAAKTSGIKIRGTGAATKGVMARGPMG